MNKDSNHAMHLQQANCGAPANFNEPVMGSLFDNLPVRQLRKAKLEQHLHIGGCNTANNAFEGVITE